MSLLPKLLNATKELGQGIMPDEHPDNQLVWADGRNCTITTSGVRKKDGWRKQAVTAIPLARGMEQMLSSYGASKMLFTGTVSKLYGWLGVGEDWVDLSRTAGYTGNATDPSYTWSLLEWGNWMVASNGVDPIQLFRRGIDSEFGNLTGSYGADDPPTFAKIIKKLGPHVIAFNTDEGGNAYEWCDTDDLSTWTPTSTNAAGGNIIRDFDSDIIAVETLGERLAIYGVDRLAIMSYLGPPFYFGVQLAIKHIGAVGPNCIVSDGRKNYGLCRRGIFVTDGASHQYIDKGHVRETLFAEINWAQAAKIVGRHDAIAGEIIWYYPTVGSNENNKGISYNYLHGGWQFLDHGRTAAADQRIFTTGFTMTEAGVLMAENTGVDDNLSAMTAYIESGATAFANEQGESLVDKIKYVEAVRLSMINLVGTDVMFELGYKMRLEDEWSWKKSKIQRDAKEPLFMKVSGRWFCFRIYSDTVGASWEIQGITVYGKLLGGKSK